MAQSGRRDVDDLLLLTFSRPREALAKAQAILAGRPGPYAASVAHQAAGIVSREFGDVTAGIRELRIALRLARRTGLTEREADVLASLGVALVYAGRTTVGLASFDRALQLSTGVQAGQVLHRRSFALLALGRYSAALDDTRHAVAVLRRAGDKVWTARALNARGLVYHAMGLPARADASFAAAERFFAETSQVLESVYMIHNRGLVASSSNDLPAALSFFDAAAARYRSLNVLVPDLAVDRCTALFAAGLITDALAEADAAAREIERSRGQATKKAELLLIAANCALAAGLPQAALDRARAAHRLFQTQQSSWGLARTGLVIVQARYGAGFVSGELLRSAKQAAARLEALSPGEAPQAHLLAARVALDLGRRSDADSHFTEAARSSRRGPAMTRASGWLSEALQAEASSNPRQLLAACRRGLEVLDEYRFTLGASELRAQATAHGAELAALAQRHAARARRPRLLLAWSERWRATALAIPAVRPSPDADISAGLAAFRRATSQVEEARQLGTPNAKLEREQRRLEGVVRTSALRARGSTLAGPNRINISDLLDQLGTAYLIELVDIDGLIQVLTCGAGRVRQFSAGRTTDAIRAADFARFALRRLARSRPGDDLDSALTILTAAGPKLQQALLGPAVRYLGGGDIVIVPPGKLQAIPWALFPALGDRVVSVAPSAGAWMRARAATPPVRRHVVFARGPGLVSDGAEVPLIAPMYDDGTVLAGSAATSQKVLYALDGAWLAHIAAHGTFRADSPLFSSLRMHDGPLTAYDLEQLDRAPYRLVLSSCDSGVQAAAGADELLGLVSSLLPLGTAGIVAAIVPLNDRAVVPVMVDLHRHLCAGRTLAEAVCGIRQGLSTDPIQVATASSLVTLGAA
jgi:tetratricopeptide (TPR) repeat protein